MSRHPPHFSAFNSYSGFQCPGIEQDNRTGQLSEFQYGIPVENRLLFSKPHGLTALHRCVSPNSSGMLSSLIQRSCEIVKLEQKVANSHP